MSPSSGPLWMAANQPRLGGGEVMLLRSAQVARDLGVDVRVVAPAEPDETARAAAGLGLEVVALQGSGRGGYARALRRWDRHRHGVLWCHGLVPGLATAGHPGRLVQLHQEPRDRAQRVASRIARWRCERLLVPSVWMTSVVAGSTSLPNWTDDVVPEPPATGARPGPRVGFLGRTSDAKGADVLARAVAVLNRERTPRVTLVVAGDDRFVDPGGRAATEAALLALGADVERRGWTSREQFFGDVDVVVVPSVANESFGLVAAEAMAARVPVVVTDAGALPEVVGAEHPWVAAAGDADDLARVLAGALDADVGPVVRTGRERWESHYSPVAGRRRVQGLLRDLGVLPVEATR